MAQVFEAASREQVVWKEVQEHSDDQVYDLLFPDRNEHVSVYEQPDWTVVHKELARVGVTLKLLHQEYVDRCSLSQLPAMGMTDSVRPISVMSWFLVRLLGLATRLGKPLKWTGQDRR